MISHFKWILGDDSDETETSELAFIQQEKA